MMNFSLLSPLAYAKIIRGAIRVEFGLRYDADWFKYSQYRVTYPGGYGASIVGRSVDGVDKWEVAELRKGELYIDDDGSDFVDSGLTEEDVVRICDNIYFSHLRERRAY